MKGGGWRNCSGSAAGWGFGSLEYGRPVRENTGARLRLVMAAEQSRSKTWTNVDRRREQSRIEVDTVCGSLHHRETKHCLERRPGKNWSMEHSGEDLRDEKGYRVCTGMGGVEDELMSFWPCSDLV